MTLWIQLFLVLFPILLVADFLIFKFSGATMILEGALAACVSSLILIVRSSKASPAALFITMYMIFFYIIPGIIHVNLNSFPFFNMSYTEGEMELAATATFLFSVFFWLGYVVPTSGFSLTDSELWARSSRSGDLAIIFGLCILCLGFGALAGFDVLNTRRGDVSELFIEYTPATLAIQSLARTSGFLAFLFSLAALKRDFIIKNLFIVIFAAACFFSTNNPISLARYVLGAYIVIIVVCFLPLTPVRKALIVSAVAIAQVTLFPAADAISRRDGRLTFSPIEYLSTHADFDGFQSTINVVRWVGGEGIGWGHQLLSAILFFVPRSLWPGKSAGTGIDAATYVGYPFVNISAPLPSEFYADFHLLGPILLAYVFGRAVRLSDETFNKGMMSGVIDAYVIGPALAAGYAIILMRGSLVAVAGPFALSLSLVVCTHYLYRIVKVPRQPF